MAQTKTTATAIVDGGVYQWTESVATSGEYHLEALGGGNPNLASEPIAVLQAGTTIAAGTVGTLANTWDWGDNDTLGYSTVYINLTGDVDPDTLSYSGLQASISETVATYDQVGASAPVTETVTEVTLAAATVTLALTRTTASRTVSVWDEDTGEAIWHAFADSLPALSAMKKIPSGAALTWPETERVAGNLYLYSVSGGDVKVVEGN